MTAELSVTVFCLYSTIGVFYLGLNFDEFSNNAITNMLVKRGLVSVGIYLMVLNSAIISSIASSGSLNVGSELFVYLWIFGWGGYAFLGYHILKTLFDAVTMWRDVKNTRRGLGNDE